MISHCDLGPHVLLKQTKVYIALGYANTFEGANGLLRVDVIAGRRCVCDRVFESLLLWRVKHA